MSSGFKVCTITEPGTEAEEPATRQAVLKSKGRTERLRVLQDPGDVAVVAPLRAEHLAAPRGLPKAGVIP